MNSFQVNQWMRLVKIVNLAWPKLFQGVLHTKPGKNLSVCYFIAASCHFSCPVKVSVVLPCCWKFSNFQSVYQQCCQMYWTLTLCIIQIIINYITRYVAIENEKYYKVIVRDSKTLLHPAVSYKRIFFIWLYKFCKNADLYNVAKEFNPFAG